jgi:hypothetical protein
MKFSSLTGNSQRLDGGAMFGNVPRAMWEKWIAPDEQHRIPLAGRQVRAGLRHGLPRPADSGLATVA